jgi:hypothetical protein
MADKSPLSQQEDEAPDEPDTPSIPYAMHSSPKLTTIRRLPSFEANLAAGKLAAEGVESFVADQNISVVHPLLFNEVRLQVREIDVERAEEILSKPVAVDADRDEDDDDAEAEADADENDYVKEAYRCPKCHRRDVDLMPFSPPTRMVRAICVVVLVLPLLTVLLDAAIPGLNISRALPISDLAMGIAWLAAFCFLVGISILPTRRKRCRQCGFEWTHDSSG